MSTRETHQVGTAPRFVDTEGTIARMADACFIEMVPDHRLAPLFKGHADQEIVAQLRRLLGHLLGCAPAESCACYSIFSANPAQGFDRRQRKVMAEIMIDCLIDEGVSPETILGFLDRFDALMPGLLPETGSAWDVGWAPRRAIERANMTEQVA